MTDKDKAVEVPGGDTTPEGKDHVQVVPEGSVDTSTESAPVHDPAEDYKVDVVADPHDEEDVANARGVETDDGKGGAVVPKPDFKEFAAGENVTAYQEGDND